MEIKIGIVESPRELVIVSELTGDDISATIDKSFNGKESVIKLNDARGRTFVIPVARIAYIEIGPDDARKVGFSV